MNPQTIDFVECDIEICDIFNNETLLRKGQIWKSISEVDCVTSERVKSFRSVRWQSAQV